MTPFGRPVVPDVKIRNAVCSGLPATLAFGATAAQSSGRLRSTVIRSSNDAVSACLLSNCRASSTVVTIARAPDSWTNSESSCSVRFGFNGTTVAPILRMPKRYAPVRGHWAR